jgi:AraC-like DNA-binding protein
MVYNQQKTDLQNTSRNVSLMADSVRSLATTAFFDDTIKDLLYSDVNPVDYMKYINKLQTYKNIYPFLQSIYIYNGDLVYTIPSKVFAHERTTFSDQSIFPILDDIQHNRSHSIVLRKIPNVMADIDVNAPKEIYVYSYLFFDSQVVSGKVSEAIILNISQDSIKQSISSSDPNNKNRIFIVDHNGKLLSDDGSHPLLSDLSGNSYIHQIISSNAKAGNMRIKVNGVDSYVTYASTDVYNWNLISITPYDSIVQDVQKMKKKTYLLVSLFIIGSILLSLYFARRLFKPINMVLENYKILESEQRNAFYYRKQDFLRQMVHSADLIQTDSLRKQFAKFQIALEPTEWYVLLLIKLDNYSNYCAKYNLKDRQLLKYGLVNIISELLTKTYDHECIDVEEDQVLVLIHYKSSDLPFKNEPLFTLVTQIQICTTQYLGISISATISEAFEDLSNVNFHYLKTLDLSYYRIILGHQSIISSESLNINTDDFKYPQDQEKELSDRLIQGQTDDAKDILSNMIRHASQYSYTILNSVLIRLLLSIRYAIEILESNHHIKVNFNFNTYLANLQKMETMDKIEADFFELFENLSKELESKKDNKYIRLLEEVDQFIQANFGNPYLSLDTIAEKVNLSPPYLGKLFKKHRLISMTDYINNVRVTYASNQIAVSEDTINEIMEKSGFSSRSHFFTLFKKAYGVTPNQYRSNFKGK